MDGVWLAAKGSSNRTSLEAPSQHDTSRIVVREQRVIM